MLALPLNAAAGKLWFEQLPVRTRQIIVAVAVGIVALVLLSVIGTWYHHSQPAYVLEVLDGINSRDDVQQGSNYLTPQGKSIILWVMDKRGDKPANDAKSVYSASLFSGNVCDIPVRQGSASGTVRLLKTDHWRFNDMYIDKVGDKRIGLWLSHMKDHPYASWWTIHGDQVFGAFCKGVLIGARVAR